MSSPQPESKIFIYGRDVNEFDSSLVTQVRESLPSEEERDAVLDGSAFADREGMHIEIVASRALDESILKSLGLHAIGKNRGLATDQEPGSFLAAA